MFYAIDFDSRCVESKSDNDRLLSKYIDDNNLELGVTLISGPDELSLKFTLPEMQDLYANLEGKGIFKHEDEAADACWEALNDNQRCFPKFTRKLGKQLITAANKKYKKPVKKTRKIKLTLKTVFQRLNK